MTRDVFTVSLYPKPNRHTEPSLGSEVQGILGLALLAFLGFVISVLVLA